MVVMPAAFPPRHRSTTPLAEADPAVLDVAVSLASSLDPEETRAHVLVGAALILGADRTMLATLAGEEVGVVAAHDPHVTSPDGTLRRLGTPLLRAVLRDVARLGGPVVRDARRLRPLARGEPDADGCEPPQSVLAVPLSLDAGTTSALVAVRWGGEPYGESDATAARALAALADRSMRNADLHQRATEAENAVRSLERVKSDFLRLASHELRAPLSVLGGYLEMLADGSLGTLPPMAARTVPIAAQKLAEMNRLVDGMLETARIEDSRLNLALAPCDACDLVRAAASRSREAGGRVHLLLPDEPVEVVADRARVETIIANLVDNAVKYSPADSPIRCALTADRTHVRVAVADRGGGIAEVDRPRLFTRFGRIVNAGTAHVPGTGLGLYLSREIARGHGGDVTVESAVGVGSTFTLSLPRPE
ncbi:MAG TPA: HAMP domain-containing sensor histidine kinase [Candidatus Dormibacteraeota bacterium]|nr:HAMP domain-containing sensor histidine kinase [Candidatus Dormibacteraeota bacterium]